MCFGCSLTIRRAIPHIPLIKAVGVTGQAALDVARSFEPYVDALLLDTHADDRIGGTGVVHDWSISRRIVANAKRPVILAGGLQPGNLLQAVNEVRPYAVDVNTAVELPNGEKDPERMRNLSAWRRASWRERPLWRNRQAGATPSTRHARRLHGEAQAGLN